ncbi:hypothetical protein ACE4WU_05200 [Enterococcus faecalis]|uniref:hypothetical protein n=1 Tax=Enterococcus faecalis TaxID=1351 RepID=UPI0035C966FB
MTNEMFIKQVSQALKHSNLTKNEQEVLEECIQKLLGNNTPEEVLHVLLAISKSTKKE